MKTHIPLGQLREKRDELGSTIGSSPTVHPRSNPFDRLPVDIVIRVVRGLDLEDGLAMAVCLGRTAACATPVLTAMADRIVLQGNSAPAPRGRAELMQVMEKAQQDMRHRRQAFAEIKGRENRAAEAFMQFESAAKIETARRTTLRFRARDWLGLEQSLRSLMKAQEQEGSRLLRANHLCTRASTAADSRYGGRAQRLYRYDGDVHSVARWIETLGRPLYPDI